LFEIKKSAEKMLEICVVVSEFWEKVLEFRDFKVVKRSVAEWGAAFKEFNKSGKRISQGEGRGCERLSLDSTELGE